jgi:hypothetical protein
MESVTVDRLYRLPPDEFVAARDELARQLRTSGAREQAAEIKALRRPSIAAWALNQVASQRADDVTALIEVAEDLRQAQELALTGGDADALRKTSKQRRDMVTALTEAAGAVLARTGRDARPQVAAIIAILDAAVANPGVAAALRAGRLVSEPEVGDGDGDAFGFLAAAGQHDVDLRESPQKAHTTGPPGARFTGPPIKASDELDRMALRKAVGRAQWERDAADRGAQEAERAMRKAVERAGALDLELEQAQKRVAALSEASADAAHHLQEATASHDESAARLAAADAALTHSRQQLEELGG